ncbi:hypothetical protein [Nocardia arthritidis]|uniref:Uncharacterized protein n=1 Tax=Nocardia arthritidis TaxID=228602 RepID=A0A6G9YUQ7_9NOCA|nr:hypothetical protein [Nocardia arthritidis]QIS16583.1 hypothetical protein F5544_43900 [Nocardia arthritidis]
MSKIASIRIKSKDAWTYIDVPNASSMVWAEFVNVGAPEPPIRRDFIRTSWATDDEGSDTERYLVRLGSFDGLSGLPNANVFVGPNSLVLWWKKYESGDFPPNMP